MTSQPAFTGNHQDCQGPGLPDVANCLTMHVKVIICLSPALDSKPFHSSTPTAIPVHRIEHPFLTLSHFLFFAQMVLGIHTFRQWLPESCSFFLDKDSSFEVSVDDLLDTTRYFRIKTLEVCLQFRTDNRTRCLQTGSRLRGFGLADLCHCFNRTTPTRGSFTPEMHLTSLEVSEIRSGIELKLFGSLL